MDVKGFCGEGPSESVTKAILCEWIAFLRNCGGFKVSEKFRAPKSQKAKKT